MSRSNYKEDDIAIIGMDCKFPNAESLEAYWDLLYHNKSGIQEIPAERWPESFYEKDKISTAKTITKWAGLLSSYDQFDPAFFGISPNEAARIDPQQRLLLMLTYGAFEKAGLPLEKVKNTKTGVFIGVSYADFAAIATHQRDSINAYTGGGTALCMIPNRISYLFNLKGPSIALDTACSSSLSALNQACESLWRGSSDMAIAGGTSLNIAPDTTIMLSQAGMLSPDGQCKTFDERANGFVKGEGAGVVILKRMEDAIKENQPILGIIKAISLNHNGKSNGLTAPNRFQQSDLIKTSLNNAHIDPKDISFIETHGTGTSLGDPIEFNALKDVFMEDRALDNPCYLGAVKTNIGHLEAAAGMAGLIKVLLAIKHKIIPSNLNFNKKNKYLSLEESSFVIPTENTTWQPLNGKRIAGISSFGFGGTNGHMIVEEFIPPKRQSTKADSPYYLLNLSAKGSTSLEATIHNYIHFLNDSKDTSLYDICYTTQCHRSQLKNRIALVGDSKASFINQLKNYQTYAPPIKKSKQKAAFLFTGQGSQYLGMADSLYYSNSIFKTHIDECVAILTPLMNVPVLPLIIGGNADLIHETTYTQAILFAIEYALAKTLETCGIQAKALIGHSLGEIVAACFAEVFSLSDGLKMVVKRGELMQKTSEDGRMLNIYADKPSILEWIQDFDRISFAAHNSTNSNVVSGYKTAIASLMIFLDEKSIKYKLLKVKRAFHAYLMDPILEEFYQEVAQIEFHAPQIPIASNLQASFEGEAFRSADYWTKHLRETTDFVSGMEALATTNCDVFIEIGPNPILINLYQQHMSIPSVDSATFVPTLLRGNDAYEQFLLCLATLYERGFKLNWEALYHEKTTQIVDLPAYPFNLAAYWLPEYNAFAQARTAQKNVGIHHINKYEVKVRTTPKTSNQNVFSQANIIATTLKILNNVLIKPIEHYEEVKDLKLIDLGLESIMIFNLRAQLKKQIVGLSEMPLDLFTDASLENFVEYIEKDLKKEKIIQLDNEDDAYKSSVLMKKWTKDFDANQARRIDQKLVHKHVVENVLLARIEKLSKDAFLVEMTQDLQHAFFYEHYLDHVPAMYMYEAILQAARAIPHLYYDISFKTFYVISEMEARFSEFAELNAPVFFKINLEDRTYLDNGQLNHATLICNIYQHDKVIGYLKGTGQFFQKETYKALRAVKMAN